ncbi:phosphonate ABC transporter, permease protein PhnE [Pseudomonas lopnurensis]|uniref:phosphonate ABC transporter, permease protein PhnE n=1 Tax=Pseudomonas lopnurensis TaxID=1477517 RepID=UPI00187AEA2D|nr:phosphonate ABC transporter, permease protein PhnE [Pseudomonas lopnurensis]MBE7376803.1 phosphonate ABC transporter, permease protein PhnE [Pseudomonas lopnurensis]
MKVLSRLLIPAALLAAVIAAFAFLQLEASALLSREGLGQMADYASGFLAPDLSPAHLRAIGHGALETLAMSAIGTLLAALLGLLLALPAAGRFGMLLQAASRLLLNALRAIPELVWAALMVLAAGLGPNAGTLALALHTAGVLGRLFAEALENTPPAPGEALRLSGSGRVAAFCYGTLPMLWPQLVAYTLYRWENNIRMASVLGFVGAGGLGQMLYMSLSLFQEAQASTVILAMLLMVLAVDSLSGWARQRWVRG